MWEKLGTFGIWKGEIWDRRKSGEFYLEEITITAVRNEQNIITNYVGLFKDITLQRRMEEQIYFQAYHDPLTGLPNRTFFHNQLNKAIQNSRMKRRKAAVLFLDLDRFKLINDTLGHSAGDQLLQQVAQRLPGCVREFDTVARVGGDEFIVLISEISSPAEAEQAAELIIERLSQPFLIHEQEYFISGSIGISMFPEDGTDLESLIKNADSAMYRAKEQGNRYCLYQSSMNDKTSERLQLETSLRKAMQQEELLLHFQPQVDLKTGNMIGVEALIRWQHPELGMVSPDRFIPIAEETGLIIPIGKWVLRTACRHNKAWQEAGLPAVRVAVNLSMLEFQQRDLIETVTEVLAETGLEPRYLELELTESIIMLNPEWVIRTLNQLKEMGIHISLDDFGTGYSSLNYLRSLPLNTLKIDRSFIRNIAADSVSLSIVKAVIDLAHSLNIKVIAEGVETEEQMIALTDNQCDGIQGYVISPPMTAEECAQLWQAPTWMKARNF
jgi:diguanylate cyclase (GGDEF)-like protein